MKETMQGASRVLDALENSQGQRAANVDSKESQLAAVNSLLRTDNNRLRDQTLQDATKIRELQSSLADKQEELLVAQRKMVQMQQNAAGEVQTGVAEAVGATATISPDVAEAKHTVSGTVDGDGQEHPSIVSSREEVERLQTLLQQRHNEVDARDAALSKAERYVVVLLAQFFCH